MQLCDDISESLIILDFPAKFSIRLDGVYESLNYSLCGIPEDPIYYNLNKAHVILPTLIEYLHKKNKDENIGLSFLRRRNRSSGLFPTPLHETFPVPVILRRDLSHEFVEDSEKIRKDLERMDIWNINFKDVDDAIQSLKKVYLQSVNRVFFKKFSEAQRVISKIFRGTVEYEYFDHDIPGSGSQFENKEMEFKFINGLSASGWSRSGWVGKRSTCESFCQEQKRVSDFTILVKKVITTMKKRK